MPQQKEKKGNKHAQNLHRHDRKYGPRGHPKVLIIDGKKVKYQDWKQKAQPGKCGCPFCQGR